jgi:hypothetical protein
LQILTHDDHREIQVLIAHQKGFKRLFDIFSGKEYDDESKSIRIVLF